MHPDKVNHMRLNLTEQMFKFKIFYLSVKILLTLHLFCKNIRRLFMNESYLLFTGSVTMESAQNLLKVFNDSVRKNISKIHLLISSPGGDVNFGITLYNYIKSLPIEIYTYNIGIVDSIAVVLYCIGSKRFCSKHARFLLHNEKITIQTSQGFNLDESQLKEIEKILNSGKVMYSDILSKYISATSDDICKMMSEITIFDKQKAKEAGLVTELDDLKFQSGINVESINTAKQMQPAVIPLPMPGILPPTFARNINK